MRGKRGKEEERTGSNKEKMVERAASSRTRREFEGERLVKEGWKYWKAKVVGKIAEMAYLIYVLACISSASNPFLSSFFITRQRLAPRECKFRKIDKKCSISSPSLFTKKFTSVSFSLSLFLLSLSSVYRDSCNEFRLENFPHSVLTIETSPRDSIKIGHALITSGRMKKCGVNRTRIVIDCFSLIIIYLRSSRVLRLLINIAFIARRRSIDHSLIFARLPVFNTL